MTDLRSNWLHELRWPEIEDYLKADDVALVPIGATEQHGRHLPLMVDTCWASVTAIGAARQAGVIVTPPVHYGWSPHHMGFPGTITLRPETLGALAMDIGQSLIYHGFKHIIFVNGNRIANLPPLEITASKLRHLTGAWVGIADTGLIAREELCDIADAEPGGQGHAGESETSLMLHLDPDAVDMDQAVSVIPELGTFAWPMELEPALEGNAAYSAITADDHTFTPDATGVGGDALNATAEKGGQMVDAIITNIVRFIDEARTVPVTLKSVDVPY